MRKTSRLALTTLLLSLCVPLLSSCGDAEDEPRGPDTTAVDDPSDPTDASDPSDPSDPSDSSDATDPTDQSDPVTPTDPMTCQEYMECIDACGSESPESEFDACSQACDEGAPQEVIDEAGTYFTCITDCTELDEAEVDSCIQQLCEPLYTLCMLPQLCKDGCAHAYELCGDDLPLDANTRHYQSAGSQHSIYTSALHVIIEWSEKLDTLPEKLTGVRELTHYTTLATRNMTQATLSPDNDSSQTILNVLRAHPAVANLYPVFTSPSGQTLISTNEVVTHFSTATALEQASTKLSALNIEVVRAVSGLENTWVLKTSATDALVAADELLTTGNAKWAHPNFLRHYAKRRVPNDPYFTQQWHLDNPGGDPRALSGADMRAVAAWDTTFGSSDILVAINDDGVDLAHPDLNLLRNDAGDVVTVNGPEDIEAALPEGCCTHGTSVAGVAAAAGDNEVGTAGVCPSCTTLPVFTDYGNPNEDAAVAETFTEPSALGAWVINNSWGPMDGMPPVIESEPAPLEPLPDVVDAALRAVVTEGRGGLGVSVVFAGGNGNEDVATDGFVSHPHTIGVAAVNSKGYKSFYSDFGDSIWVAAPSDGVLGIVTTDVRGDFGYNGSSDSPEGVIDPTGDTTDQFGGTSSAAPAVSGLLGLIYSANPALTASQAKDILRRTSRKIDQYHGEYSPDEDGFLWSPYYGYGLVDAHAAVRAAVIGCSEASSDLCEPAATCDDGPLESVTEICNGIDDDCDGEIDEEACPAAPAACATCDLSGTCDGGCTRLPNDPEPSCLHACSEESPCPEGYACNAGFCLPDAGRCSEPTEEICDGRDNDANGLVDDGACTQGNGESCQFDAECPDGFVCEYGMCFQTCESVDDCEDNDECLALADGYGNPQDTSVCAADLNFDFSCEEGCLFLYQNAPEPLFNALVGCIMDSTTCEDIEGCIPN